MSINKCQECGGPVAQGKEVWTSYQHKLETGIWKCLKCIFKPKLKAFKALGTTAKGDE